jgi:DNA-binding GntR family transcriptional regulator
MSETSFVVDPVLSTPVWKQIAGHIADQVADGRLAPGTRLPAEPTLAEQYGVAKGTIRRMMEGLREQAIVETHHGKGTYVLARER